MLSARGAIRITPFAEDELAGRKVMSPDARPGPRWAKAQGAEETGERVNVFELAVKHIADKRAAGRKVVIAGWSEGSLDRLLQVLSEHGLARIKPIKLFPN